jgi:hypothetical protein
MLITSSTAALHRHDCCGNRYVASSKDHKKRSQEKQTHCNYGARKREERERGASNPNKLLGQLTPGRMAILGPCPGPAGSHINCLVLYSRVGRLFDFLKNRDSGCFQTTYQNFKNLRFSEFSFYFLFYFPWMIYDVQFFVTLNASKPTLDNNTNKVNKFACPHTIKKY